MFTGPPRIERGYKNRKMVAKTATRVQKKGNDCTRKPEPGHKARNDGTKNRNEGIFAKTALL